MASIAKVIGNGNKRCLGECGKIKSYSEFYTRSGYGTPDNPAVMNGHFTTECIVCMKARGKSQKRLPPWESQVKSEQLAIDYLMSYGIWAQTGKATSAPDVDVVAWGSVWIEVKHAKLTHKGHADKFTFTTTPTQQDRGFLGHIVMLICEWPNERYTGHFFSANYPAFYRDDGTLKTGFVYTPGRMEPSKQGRGSKHQLTQPVMDQAKDNVEMVWVFQRDIHSKLKHGKKPVYGKVFR